VQHAAYNMRRASTFKFSTCTMKKPRHVATAGFEV
jgi:hypothetical protein